MRKFTTIILLFSIFSVGNTRLFAQNVDLEMLKSVNAVDQTLGYSKFITNTTTAVSLAVPVVMGSVSLLTKDDAMLKNTIYVVAAMGVDGVLTYSLKKMIARPRPFTTYPDQIHAYTHESSLSFPSGHTSLAFATATALSLKYPKWYVVVPAFVWAGSVGYSRMNLGVHYPSDVAAGALLGAGSAWLTCVINDWYWKKQNNRPLIKSWERLPSKDKWVSQAE